MLFQLPPRAEAVLTCNYVSRVVKGWVGYVGGGVNGVASWPRHSVGRSDRRVWTRICAECFNRGL
jgi:hypothetical protein